MDQRAKLKYLTLRTVFLISIPSFKRMEGIQSFRTRDGSIDVQRKGFTFIRQGFSNKDRHSHDNLKILLPSFSKNEQLTSISRDQKD